MGQIYAFGSNARGQLGTGDLNDSDVPMKMQCNMVSRMKFPIKDIAGGANHTIVIDGTGEVWACGSNEKGQCGFFDDDNVYGTRSEFTELVLVEPLQRLKEMIGVNFEKCWCGWDTTVILDTSGALWCFGDNKYGQCGLDPEKVKIVSPSLASKSRIDLLAQVQVSCGIKHYVAITADGSVYGWGGLNKYGELPIGTPETTPSTRFQVIPVIKLQVPLARSAACGLDYTAILTVSGEVIIYGKSKYMQNGIQKLNTGIKEDNILRIYSLWNTVIILDSSGKLSGIGRNDYKQLSFLEDLTCKCVKHNNNIIVQIATGSEHCLALLSCKCVITWGWNEHGNCGSPSSESVSYMHIISFPTTPSLVACGAGHSIIESVV